MNEDLSPSALPDKQGWIRVEDEFPKHGHYIACYFNPCDSDKRLYVITAWMSRGKWYWDVNEKEPAEVENLKITHYMPLPKPPQSATHA